MKPIPILAAALLAAACGGTPSAAVSGGSGLAYARCLRAHGVPNFPDPTSSQRVLKADPQQLGVSSTQLEAARRACQGQTPDTGETPEQQRELVCATADDCPQAVVQPWMSGLRTLAQCLRTHGVPNWPDPVIFRGAPHYPYEQAGIDHHSPQILAKVNTCVRLTGFAGLPLP
jgi:hypothetical protein